MTTKQHHRLWSLLFAAQLMGALATADASPVTFTDSYDPVAGSANLRFASTGPDRVDTLTFTHDINDGLDPYNALTDTITSVLIELRFVDDNDTVAESVTFTLDGAGFGTFALPSGTTVWTKSFSSPTIPSASLADGLLTVTLDLAGIVTGNPVGRSDFDFIDSTLTVNAERATLETDVPNGQVPIPTTLLLVGAGLAGIGWRIRRHAK